MYLSAPMQHLAPHYYAFRKCNFVFELTLKIKKKPENMGLK